MATDSIGWVSVYFSCRLTQSFSLQAINMLEYSDLMSQPYSWRQNYFLLCGSSVGAGLEAARPWEAHEAWFYTANETLTARLGGGRALGQSTLPMPALSRWLSRWLSRCSKCCNRNEGAVRVPKSMELALPTHSTPDTPWTLHIPVSPWRLEHLFPWEQLIQGRWQPASRPLPAPAHISTVLSLHLQQFACMNN